MQQYKRKEKTIKDDDTRPTPNTHSAAYFITCSRTNIDPEKVMERIDEYPKWKGTILQAIVTQEYHKEKPRFEGDPDKHIHVLIRFNKEVYFTQRKKFDFLFENDQEWNDKADVVTAAKVWNQKYIYITDPKKEGHISTITWRPIDLKVVEDIKRSKKTKKGVTWESVSRRIREGATSDDIQNEFEGFFFQNKSKVKDMLAYTARENFAKPMMEMEELPIDTPHEEVNEIFKWVNENCMPGIQRGIRGKWKGLYIYGETGLGKTTLLEWIQRRMIAFNVNLADLDRGWIDGYTDRKHQVAFIDEWRGQGRDLVFLNQFIRGGPITLSNRGSCPSIKDDCIPVIMTSNKDPFSICEAKKIDEDYILPFVNRLQIIHLEHDLSGYLLMKEKEYDDDYDPEWKEKRKNQFKEPLPVKKMRVDLTIEELQQVQPKITVIEDEEEESYEPLEGKEISEEEDYASIIEEDSENEDEKQARLAGASIEQWWDK